MQFIIVVAFIYLRLFMFDFGALFVCVTDRNMSKNSNTTLLLQQF